MSLITKSIEILASRDQVWSYLDPSKWTEIFTFGKDVNVQTNGPSGVETTAIFEPDPNNDLWVKYNIKITEFVIGEKIAYQRYGGPLAGHGLISIHSLQTGTLFRRKGSYNDNLSNETIKMLSGGMENDNRRLKNMIETETNQQFDS